MLCHLLVTLYLVGLSGFAKWTALLRAAMLRNCSESGFGERSSRGSGICDFLSWESCVFYFVGFNFLWDLLWIV